MGRPAIDLIGKRFGRLTVESRMPNIPRKHARWLCKCDCGNVTVVSSHCLIGGNVKSCGCLLVDMHMTHGGTGTRLYNVWNCMKQRCTNPANHNYKEYGERGIKVCEEWLNFEAFSEWAFSHGYDPKAKRGECTIDRIDVNGDYCPDNCRWVDMKIQASNKRRPENWAPKM